MSQILSSPLTTIIQMFPINNKRTISRFSGTAAFFTEPRFYLFKVKNRNIKSSRSRCEMCLELTVRAPKWRIIGIVQVSSLISFTKFHTFIWCFCLWLYMGEYGCPYMLVSLYVGVLIRENTGEWNPVFSHILCSVNYSLFTELQFWIKIIFTKSSSGVPIKTEN